MNEKKKVLVPTIVAVVTLIALVAGATYAYFAVGTTNNFGTTNINATAENVGTVALNAGSDLSLSVTAVDMMAKFNEETPVDVNYYATVGETTPNHTNDSTPITIGSAAVTGPGTFNCNYTLEVTPSYTGETARSSMLQQLNGMVSPEPTTGQLILYVNGTSYDLYTLVHNNNLSDVVGSIVTYEIPGTFTGISESTNSNSTKNLITAQLKLVNLGGANPSVANSQNDLAGTNLNLQIRVKDNSLTCTAVDAPTAPVLTSRTEYWTLETGQSQVNYVTASPKYTEAQKSNIQNNYYVKTTVTPTVATDDIYEIQYDDNGEIGHYGQYEGLTACQADLQEGATCVVLYSAGDIYDVPKSEACAKINGKELCMESNHWDTADETYRAAFENQTIGWQCKYFDGNSNSNPWVNTKPSSGYLRCAATDPSNLDSGSLYCEAHDVGTVQCGLYFVAGCGGSNGYAECVE